MTSHRNADKHILLVEDAESLRKMIGRQLSKLGYTVTEAANGGEALHLVENKGLLPDLIITDVIMPYMNGSELVERMRRIHPHLKAIYMSGYADEIASRKNYTVPSTTDTFGSEATTCNTLCILSGLIM